MLSTSAPQIIEHVSKSVPFTPSDVRWIPGVPRFVAVGSHPRATGALHVYELAPGETRVVAETERPAAIKCATMGASPGSATAGARHIALGDHAGRLAVVDMDRVGGGGGGGGGSGARARARVEARAASAWAQAAAAAPSPPSSLR